MARRIVKFIVCDVLLFTLQKYLNYERKITFKSCILIAITF